MYTIRVEKADYSVYIHTHRESGKSYVGITCQRPEKRWKKGKGYSQNFRFGKAIAEYGWESFDHQIIVRGVTLKKAREIEKNLIDMFDLTNPQKGFNDATGGGGSGMYEKHQSEDAKRKISEARKRIGFTEEHKRHISESKTGLNHHLAKPVYQYTRNGEFVGEWPYMNMASEVLHINKSSISGCCLGRRPTAGGYVWSYMKRG